MEKLTKQQKAAAAQRAKLIKQAQQKMCLPANKRPSLTGDEINALAYEPMQKILAELRERDKVLFKEIREKEEIKKQQIAYEKKRQSLLQRKSSNFIQEVKSFLKIK